MEKSMKKNKPTVDDITWYIIDRTIDSTHKLPSETRLQIYVHLIHMNSIAYLGEPMFNATFYAGYTDETGKYYDYPFSEEVHKIYQYCMSLDDGTPWFTSEEDKQRYETDKAYRKGVDAVFNQSNQQVD